jgi:CRP/FNR family cyclic AMP-dependent transcriptional regulator
VTTAPPISEPPGTAPSYSLLALEQDLGDALSADERLAAGRILVPTSTTRPGSWKPPENVAADSGALGFFVIEGLLMRRVVVAGTRCTELLGRGDILRPWSMDSVDMTSVPVEADWRVVGSTARFAVLDQQVTRQLGKWPQITVELFDRTIRRARWLSFQLAVCHTKQVRTRLLMILWHFADRWGRVTTAGVDVGIRLSHEILGEIVGARRPTVTTALGRLREDGKLVSTPDGRWILLGDPPDLLGETATGASVLGARAPSLEIDRLESTRGGTPDDHRA